MSDPQTPRQHLAGFALLVQCDVLMRRSYLASGSMGPDDIMMMLDRDAPSDDWTVEHCALRIFGTVPAPDTSDRARMMWRDLQRKDGSVEGEQVMREDLRTADGGTRIVRHWHLRQRVKCNRWEASMRRAMRSCGIPVRSLLALDDDELLRLRDFLADAWSRCDDDGTREPHWPRGWRAAVSSWEDARRTADQRRRDTAGPSPENYRGAERTRAEGADSRARGAVSRSRRGAGAQR